jgi:uridylate kinase
VTTDASPTPRWRRIVFKPSGEALAGPSGQGLDGPTLDNLAREIIDVRNRLDVDVAIVVGGGNFWRGRSGSLSGMDATQSDHIGMLGTVMNALALQDSLERLGQDTRVQTAIEMPRIAEAYIRRRAVRHLEKGRVVIFLKGTHSGVDGVYDSDPRLNSNAKRYDEVGYLEVMTKDLRVMDATAIAFCRDHSIPIVVFDMTAPGSLSRILEGERVGTIVHDV